ncbi:MAG TPA: ABC transporter substrate-binding protein [Spirochaetota bacterium]|nr:ABC transporter substrate-binding protein [Spirochaetota bacterium]HOM37585.1 ABC transporter substrate-binding protein [Spirochaetota bacterium]HPQ49444.1 ABC transporter substrate-binding protein [Spirochaetota bacterium]
MKKFFLSCLLILIYINIFSKPVYNVVLIIPLTGNDAAIGNDIKEGLNTFLKYMDSVGGFNSYDIVFKIIDNGSKSINDSIKSYFIKNKDSFIITAGCLYDEEILYLSDFAEREKIPYIFPINVSFKKNFSKYVFPVIPDVQTGYKFLREYFRKENLEYSVIYNQDTKENAFTIFENDKLIDVNDPSLVDKIKENTVLFLSSKDDIISVLKKVKDKTKIFFNHDNINIINKFQEDDEKKLLNNSIFINWVKPANEPSVEFFIGEYKKNYDKEPNNYNLIGWSIGDIIYETVRRGFEKNMEINRDIVVSELEKFGDNGGYDSTLYKVYYSEFASELSRIGISGFYFVMFKDSFLIKNSDFFDYFDIIK